MRRPWVDNVASLIADKVVPYMGSSTSAQSPLGVKIALCEYKVEGRVFLQAVLGGYM